MGANLTPRLRTASGWIGVGWLTRGLAYLLVVLAVGLGTPIALASGRWPLSLGQTAAAMALILTGAAAVVFARGPLLLFGLFITFTFPKAGIRLEVLPLTAASLLFTGLAAFGLLRALSGGLVKRGLPVRLLGLGGLVLVDGLLSLTQGTVAYGFFWAILEFLPLIFFVPLTALFFDINERPGSLRATVAVLTIAAWIVCLYGFLQLAVGPEAVQIPGLTSQVRTLDQDRWWLGGNEYAAGALKLFSTYQNGNLLAASLNLLWPTILAASFVMKRRLARLFMWQTVVLCLAALLFTAARSGIIGMAIGLVILWGKVPASRPLLLVSLVVGAAAALTTELGRLLLDRVVYQSFQSDATGALRIQDYRGIVDGLFAVNTPLDLLRPLLGVGLGSSGSLGMVLSSVDSHPFNLLLKFGLFGLSLHVLLLAALVREILRDVTFGSFESTVAIGAGTAVIAMLSESLIDGVFLFPPTATNFWSIAGIGLAAAVAARRGTLAASETGAAAKSAR